MNALGYMIGDLVRQAVATAGTATEYREPLLGFARAADPRFRDLRATVSPIHLMPEDLVPGARTVVSFFLPFAPWVVEANVLEREGVAREWAVAYVETNALIGRIAAQVVDALTERGIAAGTVPATHNFDEETLHSGWSHKSVAVIAGLGSFGLHQMVICLECVARCPASALGASEPLDKHRCHEHLHGVARAYEDLGLVDVCGKCAIGPCSLGSAASRPGSVG